MSLNSWKRKYYKGRIRSAAADPLSAVKHSLKKWKGLRPDKLEEHGLVVSWGDVVNPVTGKAFVVNNETCALCVMCQTATGCADCGKCPVVEVTGKTCDGRSGNDSAYGTWIRDNNPEPMIKLLKHVRDKLKEKACS